MDETIFNGQEINKNAWSNQNQNVILKQVSAHNQTLSVMGAISSIQGQLFSNEKQGYFNTEETIQFVQYLKRQNCGTKIALFLDNCSIHHSKQMKQYCEKIKLPLVFNIAYSPWYNGIEKIWGIWKFKFRNLITKIKSKQQKFNMKEIVFQTQKQITKEEMKACVSSGWKTIFQNIKSKKNFQQMKIK